MRAYTNLMALTTVNLSAPIPDRGITQDAVYWLPGDSAGAPFAAAHAHYEGGTIPLTEIRFGDTSLGELPLVGMLRWSSLESVVVAHFPNNWETLLFVGTTPNGARAMVSMPTQVLQPGQSGVPEGFTLRLSEVLNDLYLSGQIDTVEDNLDPILDIALPPEESEENIEPEESEDNG